MRGPVQIETLETVFELIQILVCTKPYRLPEVFTFSISLVTCHALSKPLNGGQIALTDDNNYNSTATFKCSTGFNLNGSLSLTCRGDHSSANGNWTGSEPTCSQSKSQL
jgi:hypothetical protein